ncbi:MAG: peptidoglycan editing factor PgeF [Porticoccaceae bacterium]|nr:peptidoglycan editing factor PgeF [Porticoccaceae bacterium]
MGSIIVPQWPAPPQVKAAITTRMGGHSVGCWQSFNLASHVGDDPAHVESNRDRLNTLLELKTSPLWLNQIHGNSMVCAYDHRGLSVPTADGSYSCEPGIPCAVLTADCLPVLLCDEAGTVVAAAHAGWRGLANGILRNAVASMGVPAAELMAYLGPAISQTAFEVGQEVQQAFIDGARDGGHRHSIGGCFREAGVAGKFFADLYGLARAELNALGVSAVYGGHRCTYGEPGFFYSFRRDGVTGRMASLIWLDSNR